MIASNEYRPETQGINLALAGAVLQSGAPDTAPKEFTERKVSKEPPYKVILHNDDFTPMEHVIDALKKVVGLSSRLATDVMLEAHKNGRSVVTKCHRELAELYQEGLVNEGLISTIEPD
ncbi:hypothetical protein RradSPS_0967 [Rubrobacter radiotolerans]|uniref:ATP-dependent Clp protease adapter protein ClpS n=1 Tax=Rubrobacter radiotolerans TaxID=42256 RepID=A0A023X2M2_RUBRA|nr:ATP-dependent Clp protease adaptor ClpS [Rubrobacter radiotolerans]AHY46250.1 hypothetical protein RradSPS_0967 [Rubrobacter radiotolerans]MDX5893658.1 ATP-dependent Clp protease adaptor ClpS [Rubrobacter radiotolerans]SMC04221.1 ATP-dependent Clp protease adaptor protein ClpS [Rubrobacter radiotolerans DSM 5868]